MNGASGRYVRLQLSGKSYFHLDEVELYPVDAKDNNIAKGKPATQSSVSEWSAAHGKVTAAAAPAEGEVTVAAAAPAGGEVSVDSAPAPSPF